MRPCSAVNKHFTCFPRSRSQHKLSGGYAVAAGFRRHHVGHHDNRDEADQPGDESPFTIPLGEEAMPTAATMRVVLVWVRERLARLSVTAVLETSPPIKPVMRVPLRAPMIFETT